MDLGFSEEQEMLRNSARDFFLNELPKDVVKEMATDEKGYVPDLWKKMAELGWMGLVIPEEYDGMGMSYLDLVVLLEEMGRACLTGPYFSTVVLGGYTIMEAGSEEQKKELLTKIANGEIILALALTEPSAKYEASAIAVSAKAQGDDYVIDGTKLFVENAHIADYLIVAARTKEGGNAEDGISLFLVDAKSPGISTTVLKTMAGDKQCEVIFDKVKVPKKNLLGGLDKGWPVMEKMLEKATVGLCAQMVGGAQMALEMSVTYAKERVQFGRPIGSFQAIQHYCANMVTDVDGSKFVTYEAAWKLSEGLDASMEVSMAKAWTSEAYRRVTLLGHQIHGGIGFCIDHDMPLYFKRAKAAEPTFGDPDWHREKVAQELG
ncbi:MAG: acyl-CoA dehydrogenase family protein, partial [Chloroflexota bacterium]|nr:acyl-CoA dehydrogenase family protein [Chloroflexota bacterium]